MSDAKEDVKRIKEELEKDTRDVSALWNDALRNYKGIVGVGLTPTYTSVDEMIKAGTEQMNAFHKFRHNDKKVDKLRSLFMSNLDYIEKGAQQIIAAATPAFPPAAAIGTALTYMLSACKQVSADYDVVTAFFEDMNAFLQRITILESRLPSYPAYRNCLMDVFTAVLDMCGFATKYIQLRRFKKWILNMIRGEDTELAGARQKMDTRLSRLQSATEYAILGNTEKLQTMSAELKQNEEMQTQMLEEQTRMLETVIEGQDNVRNDLKDIRKLLSVFEEQRREESHSVGKQKSAMGKPPTSNRVRAFFYDLIDPAYEYRNLKDSFIPEMSTWIFEEPEWAAWLDQSKENDTSKLLYIAGPPGSGKSHIAVAAHDRLVQLAERENDGNTCVVHFYFRETRGETRTFYYAINWLAIQIAERNANLCEKINVELSREDIEIDVDDWTSIWHKVIAPLFAPSSPARLQIVFDGLDELAPDGVQRPAGFEFLNMVAESDLNISVLCTTRSASSTSTFPEQLDGIGSMNISVTKEKQMPDLKTLIWHHLDNDASLKKLSQYMRQRISSTLEEKADCLLYAEHILRRFSNLNREPLILRHLEHEMPDNLEQIYSILLSDLLRKTSPEQRQALKNLFSWLAFAVRPITLSEALSIVKFLPGSLDLEEELQGQQLARFLRIADRVEAVILSSKSSATDLEGLQDQGSRHEGADDDWNLPLKFQERAMRDYFRAATFDEDPESLRTSGFEAHRQIFVTLSQILRREAGTDGTDELRGFAAGFWLMHLGWVWALGKLGRPTEEQKIELLDAMGAVFNDEGSVATNVERNDYYYEYLGTSALETKFKWFAVMASDVDPAKLKDSTAAWIQDVSTHWQKAFVNLAKAHVRKWFAAMDVKTAQQSYGFARSALGLTDLKHLLHETNYNEDDDEDESEDDETLNCEEILLISKAFPDITDQNTSYAVALLLHDSGYDAEALPEAQQALDLASSDPTKKFEVTDLLANIQSGLEDFETAYTTITSILAHTTDIPAALVRRALVTRARIEAAREMIDDAMASYQAARLALPDTPMLGDDLQDQFDILNQHLNDDPAAIVSAVRTWSPLERLAWATWRYDAHDSERHTDFQRACGRANETAFMLRVYEETIALLDAVESGAPMRIELAKAHWHARGDLPAAKTLVDEVLDADSDGTEYRFTGQDPSWALSSATNLLTDILYAQFRTSADPQRKIDIIAEMKNVPARPLARSVSAWKSMDNHHRLVLARMVKKTGPMIEYQALLRKAFDVSYEALFDNVGWNDAANLRDLALVLDVMGGLEKEARMLISAQFLRLDTTTDMYGKVKHAAAGEDGEYVQVNGEGTHGADEENGEDDGKENGEEEGDQDDDASDDKENGEDEVDQDSDSDSLPSNEGDLLHVAHFCDGPCKDTPLWRFWGDRPLYICAICADVSLCEPCYLKRQAYDKDSTPTAARSEVGAEYCGAKHRYIKAPIEGWKGVKNGMMRVEGENDVEFKAWLKGVKEERWEGAWRAFWLGED